MKKIFFVLMMCANVHAYPQGLSNFFSQKEADIKYMLAQIAELQTYIVDVEKGYHIAQQGLTFIGELKKGEFDLHNAFFSSLATVNPAIKNYQRVADIISMQSAILSSFKKMLSLKNFSTAELEYLQRVYSNMAGECSKSLQALIDVLTDETFQMKDNERMARIDQLYSDMLDKQAFTQSFTAGATILSLSRASDLNDIGTLKNYYP